MLALACAQEIYLPPPRGKSADSFASHPEENQLSDISEVESDTASVTAAVLAYLVPYDVRFVFKTPSLLLTLAVVALVI